MKTIQEQITSLTRIGCYTERAQKLTSLEKKIVKKEENRDKVNKAVEDMRARLNLK